MSSERKPEPATDTAGLAEQPFAWVVPGDDNSYGDGWLAARIDADGEFTKPLYARPQSAALDAKDRKIDALRDALKEIADFPRPQGGSFRWGIGCAYSHIQARARAALKEIGS